MPRLRPSSTSPRSSRAACSDSFSHERAARDRRDFRDRQRRASKAQRARAAQPRRLPQERARAHRHPRRLRARRVRRLHGARRRRNRALVPHVRRSSRRMHGRHDRRPLGLARDRGAAERVRAHQRAAMRVLHAGRPHGGAGAPARRDQPHARAHPRISLRQLLPLHRLPGDRRCDRGGGQGPLGKERTMKRLLAALAATAFAVLPVSAQDYPAKPLRLIVPLAAGGIADNLARTLGQKITEATKQPVIVDNRPGAASVIGTELAARAQADGYTIFMGGPGPLTELPYLRSNLPFDPVRDFVPIINIVTFANLLVVHPSVPANSLAELIALARAKPGTLSFASQGTASSGHMVGEQFKLVAELDIVHIPYKGAAPAVQDLVGGQVSMMFDSVLVSMPHVRAGRLRALAITSRERNPGAPEVPTMAEAGLPGLEAGVWFGLFAPAGTPRPVVDWWNRETRRIFSEPELRNRMVMQGATLDLGSPEKFAALMASDSERWGRVIKSAGIKGE